MRIEEIKNKETGEFYKTKTGEICKSFIIEVGDKFVPKISKVIEREGKYINYKLPVDLITKDNVQFEGIFINLSKTQADIINQTEDPTQQLYTVYEYKNAYGSFLGISCKELKPSKTLADFGFGKIEEEETK